MFLILWLRNWFIYIIVAIASSSIVNWLNSDVVEKSLLPNLTGTIIALLAINVATTAAVAVKLRDIADQHQIDFSPTAREFRMAIIEQAGLVIISLALMATQSAKPVPLSLTFMQVSSLTVFYASLHIFVDTSLGLVAILFPGSE